MEAAAAISGMGNLAVSGTYRTYQNVVVNYKTMRIPTNHTIACVVRFRVSVVDRENNFIPDTDVKIIVPRKDLSFEILAGNEIIVDAVTYTIIDVKTDPAESLYTIQAR